MWYLVHDHGAHARKFLKKIMMKDAVGVMNVWSFSFNMPSNTSIDLLIRAADAKSETAHEVVHECVRFAKHVPVCKLIAEATKAHNLRWNHIEDYLHRDIMNQ